MSHFDGGERIIFGDGGLGGGLGGGFGGGFGFLALLVLLMGRGFLGRDGLGLGAGAGAVAAEAGLVGGSRCGDFLAMLNAINATKEAVANSAVATSNEIGTGTDRVLAAQVASFNTTNQNMTNQINDIKNTLGIMGTGLVNGFNTVGRESDHNFASLNQSLCQSFNTLTAGISCGFSSVKDTLFNLSSMMTAQNTAVITNMDKQTCALLNQGQQTQSLVAQGFEKILCSQANDTNKILCAIADADKNNRIRELEERLGEERGRRQQDVFVSIGDKINALIGQNNNQFSSIQAQVGTLLSSQTNAPVKIA